MHPRERVVEAIGFRSPDRIPVRIFPAPGGVYEHGEKLIALIRECGHDFGDLSRTTVDEIVADRPQAEDFERDGRYHAYRTDDWGTRWEYRIYGVWGHPVGWPLDDMDALDSYCPPRGPDFSAEALQRDRQSAAVHRERYFLLRGGGSLFERMHSLRRFEQVLMDIEADDPATHRMADMIAEHMAEWVRHALALDADGVSFGDDFGMSSRMLLAPKTWRRFFKPRYRALFDPVRSAGKRVFFHCCGWVEPILEDLKEIGVDVIWPQLPVYDLGCLADRCRSLRLVVELHPDRGDLMQKRNPEGVRDYILRLIDRFRTCDGGSWLYLEIDPGFCFENVRSLFETVQELRR